MRDRAPPPPHHHHPHPTTSARADGSAGSTGTLAAELAEQTGNDECAAALREAQLAAQCEATADAAATPMDDDAAAAELNRKRSWGPVSQAEAAGGGAAGGAEGAAKRAHVDAETAAQDVAAIEAAKAAMAGAAKGGR